MYITTTAEVNELVGMAHAAMRNAQTAAEELERKQAAERRAWSRLSTARKALAASQADGSATYKQEQACTSARTSLRRASDAAAIASYKLDAHQHAACALAAQALESALRNATTADGTPLVAPTFSKLLAEALELVSYNRPGLKLRRDSLNSAVLTYRAPSADDACKETIWFGAADAAVFSTAQVFSTCSWCPYKPERIDEQAAAGYRRLKSLRKRAEMLAADADKEAQLSIALPQLCNDLLSITE